MWSGWCSKIITNVVNALRLAGVGNAFAFEQVGSKVTLSSPAASMSVPVSGKTKYEAYFSTLQSIAQIDQLRLNGDNSASWSTSMGNAGTTDAKTQNAVRLPISQNDNSPKFSIADIWHKSNQSAIVNSNNVGRNAVGAGSVTTRREGAGRYSPTVLPASITSVDIVAGVANFLAGSEMFVLGNVADVIVENPFWQEAGFVELRGDSTEIVIGLNDQYDYLWLITATFGGNAGTIVRFNGDQSGTDNVDGNYAHSFSQSMGTDVQRTNRTDGVLTSTGSGHTVITSTKILNKLNQEKLYLGHSSGSDTTNVDVTVAPRTDEIAGKWSGSITKRIEEITVDWGAVPRKEGSFGLVLGGNPV